MVSFDNFKFQLNKRFINLLWNIVFFTAFVLFIFGAVWIYAAFIEPSSAPSASNQDFVQNILGADNANNAFDSSSVSVNNDGSIVERLKYIVNYLDSR